MGKIICCILALSLCLCLFAGCQLHIEADIDPTPTEQPSASRTEPTEAPSTEEPTTEAPALQEPSEEAIREQAEELESYMTENGKLASVAYLGNCEGDFTAVRSYLLESGIAEARPLVWAVEESCFVENVGDTLFLVVLRQDVGVTVFDQVMDEVTGNVGWGDTLHTELEGRPLLLRGNLSDIMSNLVLFIEGQGGEGVEYSPYLSLMDGSLSRHSMIYDLSPYDLLNSVFEEDPRLGNWYAQAPNTAGDTMLLELYLGYDGAATYAYGPDGGERLEYFEGTWAEQGEDTLTLTMVGGPLEVVGDSLQEKEFTFRWSCEDGHLYLTHSGGSSLIFGLEGGTLDFTPTNRYLLSELWSTTNYLEEEQLVVCSELELQENGSCSYLEHDGDGHTYGAYEGTWDYEGGLLVLNMTLYSGSLYEAENTKLISGKYFASTDRESGVLCLYLEEGYALTDYMVQTGMEYFSISDAVG